MKHKIAISELLNYEEENKKVLKPLRKRIGSLQIAELQALFDSGIRFPDKQLRERMGEKMGLTPRTIQVWFQNRRQNSKCTESMQDDDIQTVSILQSLRLALK
jgi:2-keto-4-pentenoate hydratase